MAYTPANLALIAGGLGDNFRLWVYKSTDAATTVRTSGYFSDGGLRGMKAGDVVISIDTDASPISAQIHLVTSVTSGAADLSDGVAITATDTD